MVVAAAAAAALFFVLWYMLESEDNPSPWVPAGLAAAVVMLVAASARGLLMRRAWSHAEQSKLEYGLRAGRKGVSGSTSMQSSSFHSAALRALQKEAAAADQPGSLPEAHLETYNLCQDYLAGADEALLSPALPTENRVALRAGQERVRAWQKHHLLAWACNASRALTHEAQQRARLSEKIELGNRALGCIDTALKVYPDEAELNESAYAIREFMTSSKVAHWVELGERAAFKGQYRRAIDCYSDAVFYLTRDGVEGEHRETVIGHLTQEIESLRARLSTETPEPEPRGVRASAKRITKRKNR
jgi:tetratricopeptide (TPR) repeat protein